MFSQNGPFPQLRLLQHSQLKFKRSSWKYRQHRQRRRAFWRTGVDSKKDWGTLGGCHTTCPPFLIHTVSLSLLSEIWPGQLRCCCSIQVHVCNVCNRAPRARENNNTRNEITKKFLNEYGRIHRRLVSKYKGTTHWAKIEEYTNESEVNLQKDILLSRFPCAAFDYLRKSLDPNCILSNDMMTNILS